jgi:DNA-directed RNA polymerase subunit RPC12/RpoP
VPPGQASQKCRCPKCNAEIVAPSPPARETQQTPPAFEDDFFSDHATGLPAPVPAQSPAKNEIAAPSPSAQGAQKVQQAFEDDIFSENATAQPASVPAQSPPQSEPQRRHEAATPGQRASLPPKNEASPAQGATKRSESAPAPKTCQEFGIECVLCGSRVYATLDQVGEQVKCPDCHSKVLVKPPKTPIESAPVYESDDGDFKLSEPVEIPESAYLRREVVRPDRDDGGADTGRADGTARRKTARERRPGDAMRDQARDTLTKAQAELDEEERAKPKLPDQPFKTGVISFIFDAAAMLRLVLVTLAGHTAVASLVLAFIWQDAGPVQQFGAIFLFVVFTVLGLASAFIASACCAAIIQETANGCDKLEQWPGMSISDWMMDSLYVFNSLFASVALGILPCLLVATTEITTLAGAVTGIALFPVFVLSAMEEGSPLGFASRPMWRSLQTASQLWLKFYLLSVALAFGGLLATYLLAVSLTVTGGFLIGAFFSAILVAIGMVYCRLLGRLAWCLSEQTAEDDDGASARGKTVRSGGGAQPRRDADDALSREERPSTTPERPAPSAPPPSGAEKGGVPVVKCPHCKVVFKANDAGLVGKEVPCPMCQKPFVAQPMSQPSGQGSGAGTVCS